VGSPPQRVSVIVDTGSHHTAFPCMGCNCGKHMNELYDPKKSKSSKVKHILPPSFLFTSSPGLLKYLLIFAHDNLSFKVIECFGSSKNRCSFSQSYSEGSSWRAYKVSDVIWVGGSSLPMVPEADKLSSEFTFGCMESETGLFRGQIVDGIMGMSAAHDTLAFRLYSNKITRSRAFSMCFRVGGGVLTLGGLDTRLNYGDMKYIRLIKGSGWFTVRLLEVFIRSGKDKINVKSVDATSQKYNSGKGCIVDSGTTDTYLPSSIAYQFNSIFKELSGMSYSNKPMEIKPEIFENLPVIVFKFESTNGKPVYIEMPPESYSEQLDVNKYAFRIYVNEVRDSIHFILF